MESTSEQDRAAHALIALDAVDVAIDGAPVLHRVSWALRRGEHWGVIGANGSGKTSFLRLLSGALWPKPGGGERRYDFGSGSQRDAVQAQRRIVLIGHELQDRYARWGWSFSALDVVLSGLYRTDVPRKRPQPGERARALALMRELGVAALADRSFLELSRGEQRRVLIARGFAFRPAVLLLDEPASGLDRAARRELDTLIEAVVDRGPASVVCSAHAALDLPCAIDNVLVLELGRVIYAGPRSASARSASRRASREADRSPATEGSAAHVQRVPSEAAHEDDVLIEVEHADVWLGPRRVLHDIDWRLRRDEHWLVTGPNGSGKSTLLRLLHGQVRPAVGGHVRWPALGNPRNVWTIRRNVAWVSPELQAAYRYPTTVSACIASGFDSSIGLTRELRANEQARIAELLELFELESFATRQVATLSYGQFRRTLIARSLVNRPCVLLLDEPWEGLDEPASTLLDAALASVAARGTQLVCASHVRHDERLFTHELVLEHGSIVRRGGAGAARREN